MAENRVTKIAAEVWHLGGTTDARFSTLGVEVATGGSVANAQFSFIGVEIASGGSVADAQFSFIGIEILKSIREMPKPKRTVDLRYRATEPEAYTPPYYEPPLVEGDPPTPPATDPDRYWQTLWVASNLRAGIYGFSGRTFAAKLFPAIMPKRFYKVRVSYRSGADGLSIGTVYVGRGVAGNTNADLADFSVAPTQMTLISNSGDWVYEADFAYDPADPAPMVIKHYRIGGDQGLWHSGTSGQIIGVHSSVRNADRAAVMDDNYSQSEVVYSLTTIAKVEVFGP